MITKTQNTIGTHIDVFQVAQRMGRIANNGLTDDETTVLLSQAIIIMSVYRDMLDSAGIDTPTMVKVPKEFMR